MRRFHFCVLVLCLAMFNLSCSPKFLFNQINGFETYKIPPYDLMSFRPKTNGYYVARDSDETDFIFFKDDGTLLFGKVLDSISKAEFQKKADMFAENTREYSAHRIDNWGHYAIRENQIKLQYRKWVAWHSEFLLVGLSGQMLNDSTFLMTNRNWDWTVFQNAEKPNSEKVNLLFRFIESDVDVEDSDLIEKRWYRKNVWYNIGLHSKDT